MERQNILTVSRRNRSRKVVSVSGRRACRGPTSVCRREEPVATSTWRRRSFMDLRFGLSSGPVAVGLVAAGLGDDEHSAARQHCLTKQGSPEPGTQPKADLALASRVASTSCSGLENSQDYILVTEAICPNCKLITGMGTLLSREPFLRRFA